MPLTARLSQQAVREHDGMKLVPQIARFATVGVINTAVDLAVLNTLIAISHRGRSGLLYSLFKAISFLVAVLNSYWLNSRWAFRSTAAGNTSMRVGRFISVSVLGLAINVGIASWVAGFAGPVKGLASWWPSVAALAGAGCALAFNFAGYKYLVFHPRRTERMDSYSALRERGGPSVRSIDDGLERAAVRPVRTVAWTSARDHCRNTRRVPNPNRRNSSLH